MSTVARYWNRFWFEPSTASHLVLARFVLYGGLAWRLSGHRSAQWTEVPANFWQPVSFYDALGLSLPGAATLDALDRILLVAALLSAVGLCSRVSMSVTALLGLFLIGLSNNFGKINHGENVTAMILCLMPFSRAGMVCSVDAFLRARLRPEAAPPPRRSGEYTWPIRAACVCLVLLYFSAGMAKLITSGVAWVTSDNLEIVLLRTHYGRERPPIDLGLTLARHPPLARAAAAVTLALEVLSPLAFVHRWAFYAIGVGLAGLQVGIWLVMGIAFRTGIYLFILMWPPWGRWIDGLLDLVHLRQAGAPCTGRRSPDRPVTP
jgi:hypothetical protein